MSAATNVKKDPGDRRREALRQAREQIVREVVERADGSEELDLVESYKASTRLLGQYVTLDWPHHEAISRVRKEIARYAADKTRKRPLNILMQADPGSGKSHFVKCLAEALREHNVVSVDYNMANLQGIEDLAQPLDAVRNFKVLDRLAILFLDEFDADPRRYPILLPLLWDGELNVGHRLLRLGKVVIILAGSGRTISAAMAEAKAMNSNPPPEGAKLVDLLSRINGSELEIPSFDLVSEDRDRRADKVCLTVSVLQSRFAGELVRVPLALLRFVARSKFRYGVRSITHLIDLIQPFRQEADASVLQSAQLRFPLDSVSQLRGSSLAYHVFSEDGPAAIVELWKQVSEDTAMVQIKEPPDEEIPF